MVFSNIPPEHYARPEDVEAILRFPDFDRPAAERAIAQAAGEYNVALMLHGIEVPIESPPALVEKLGRGVAYGAAAAMLGSTRLGQKPDDVTATVQLYLSEYHRVLNEITAWSREHVAALGLGPQAAQTPPRVAAGGFLLASNKWVEDGVHWSHKPPFILKDD